MVDNSDNVEVLGEQRSGEAFRDLGFKYIEKIDPANWPPSRVKGVYDHILAQEWNWDDFGKANPELFVRRLFEINSEHYVIGDKGYIALVNIIPHINADIHYTAWNDAKPRDVVAAVDELEEHAFVKYNLNRITAYIPKNNEQAIRMATICGYKFEGSMRGMFLQGGKFHDLHIYGMTKDDFARRKVRH